MNGARTTGSNVIFVAAYLYRDALGDNFREFILERD
jgi:hypothetical protein